MNNTKIIGLSLLILMFMAACATPIKGTVFKQKDGTYKATYSAKTEKNALRTTHSDAASTCKKRAKTREFIVVDQKVETMTEKANGETKGFAAVAGSAVRAADKYFGSENVRATLVFECDRG